MKHATRSICHEYDDIESKRDFSGTRMAKDLYLREVFRFVCLGTPKFYAWNSRAQFVCPTFGPPWNNPSLTKNRLATSSRQWLLQRTNGGFANVWFWVRSETRRLVQGRKDHFALGTMLEQRVSLFP